VRRVDLATGELHNVRTDDSELDKPMAGRARTSVLAPDGSKLYTLYIVAHDSYGNGGYAFVHVLDLVSKTAFCVDLPVSFGNDGPASYAVAVSQDGKDVYVVDGARGVVADLDTEALAIGRIGHFAATPERSVSAAVGAGGRLFIGTGRELLVVQPNSLDVQRRWSLNGAIAAVLTTPLDSNVYVAANGTIAIFNGLDVGAGPRSVIDVPGAPGLAVAEPTPSVDNRGPTHCAC
jgi:DNA-binding beta-propeller fold protein YncE